MKKLELHPTSTSAWQNLVKEASFSCHGQLNEELESYLVFLLMRLSNEPGIIKKVVALDFLESANKTGKQQEIMQKDVGDNCLIFSGLFPGQAKRRRVNISYFVHMGRTAYSDLGTKDGAQGMLFRELSNNFVLLMDTLHCIRELDGSSQSLDLLEAADLWLDTGSIYARDLVQKNTNGCLINTNASKVKKH